MKMGNCQIRFGIKAGINIVNQTNAYSTAIPGTQTVTVPNGKSLLHFNGGVFTEVPFSPHIIFRPQILVSSAGFKSATRYDMLGNVFAAERKYTLNYINVPLQLLYSMETKIGKAWIGVGPYAGILVNGFYKSSSGTVRINIGNGKDDDYRSLDAGISFSTGLLFNKFLISIEQDTGLADVTPGPDKSRNIIWSFCFGYSIK
jgi:hypothetical protein